MRLSKSLHDTSLQTNPQLARPFWQVMGELWKNSGLEKTLLELVRIKSANMVGCRQ